MRDRIVQTSAIFANIAICITALTITVVAIKKFWLEEPRPAAPSTREAAASLIGRRIKLPSVNWSSYPVAVVMVLSTDCHFCSASAPFYRKLSALDPQRVRLIAVLPQPRDLAERYLSGLDIHPAEVRQSSLADLGVRGTPTLLLANRDGVATNAWVGRLTPIQESDVLEKLN